MTGVDGDRLLAFTWHGAIYALPIAEVAEVAEVDAFSSVPMLPSDVGGVVNHHGDALPVVFGAALFGAASDGDEVASAAPSGAARHLLVLARDPDDPSRWGLPVDEVWGLVPGPAVSSPTEVVADRRPVEGRLVNVLDPDRLLERAVQVVEGSMNGA